MIGLVVVTHGRMAAEMIAAMEHVVGPQEAVRAISIGADDDMEQRRQDIIEAASDVDTGDGVIVCTDMFGGTPSNLAISIMDVGARTGAKVEVIAGVNLPMLVKLASVRTTETLPKAVAAACDSARKYISVASSLLQDAT
ncbi:MAG: PTS sugar transporter subunit IIA [Alphaproteobacteria bacterium]|nr:PTS sugar transporter subunit IIA [Alphaproteobacteria bacterium SS10]